GAVGGLALGIVKGADWGWSSGRVLAAFGTAAVLMPLFVLRSLAHATPVADLGLFRLRSFTVATIGTFVFGAGFFASLLCKVLFPAAIITGVGVGLSLPALGSAAVLELPPPSLATGIGMTSALRQLGAVVGVAALVALLGTPGAQALGGFRHAWLMITGAGWLAAVVSLALGRVRAPRPELEKAARQRTAPLNEAP